jgi:glycosyltransferase involved in cell wall biosynthesis
MNQNNHILTISIPTYNRAKKLIRLLSILRDEIIKNQLSNKVLISISDNSENYLTRDAYMNFDRSQILSKYHKQEMNIGFDRNLVFLYNQCETPFNWFISDDDYPLEGSLSKIVSGILSNNPDVLLFSFIQPPGSKARHFNYKSDIHVINNDKLAIEAVLSLPKLSIYVMRKINLSNNQHEIIVKSLGQGWIFLTLAICVLENSLIPKVAIISEPLATADEDYTHIWVPTPFLHEHKIAQHPYIVKKLPNLEKQMKIQGYLNCISFSWALKKGVLTLDDDKGLDVFIKNLEWRFPILFRHPKTLIQFLLMKLNMMSFVNKK